MALWGAEVKMSFPKTPLLRGLGHLTHTKGQGGHLLVPACNREAQLKPSKRAQCGRSENWCSVSDKVAQFCIQGAH